MHFSEDVWAEAAVKKTNHWPNLLITVKMTFYKNADSNNFFSFILIFPIVRQSKLNKNWYPPQKNPNQMNVFNTHKTQLTIHLDFMKFIASTKAVEKGGFWWRTCTEVCV